MKRIFFALLYSSFLIGCAGKAPVQTSSSPFSEVRGCFLLYNMKTEKFDRVWGEEFCRERYPAASSFKVALAVMAFDSGVLKDQSSVLKWDGKRSDLGNHNRDHDAQSWMKESVVWYSQRLTPKIGKKKLQKYLRDFNYGNQNLKDGLTQAWLTSPSNKEGALNISAYEQIDFLKKLWTGTLPASARAQQITREITYLETSPQGFKLSGKTGSNFFDKEKTRHFGWFIGHIIKGDQEYLVANNIQDLTPHERRDYGGPRAKTLTKAVLLTEGLW